MIHIIADTTSCLEPAYAKDHQIQVIPQIINFGADSFYEGVDMDIETFTQRLHTLPELPKTAAPPPELFTQVFARLAPLGEPILCIMPSAEISGTVRSASVAALDFPELNIQVVDTRLIASPLGTVIKKAAGWVQDCMDLDMVVQNVMSFSSCCHLYFMVDTLEFLARGGRIGGASALLGSILQIKPILRLNNGMVDQYKRERTSKRAIARMKEIVLEQYPVDGDGCLTVMYSGANTQAQILAADLGELVGEPSVPIFHVPPAVVAHGGPGILGVGFFSKINLLDA